MLISQARDVQELLDKGQVRYIIVERDMAFLAKYFSFRQYTLRERLGPETLLLELRQAEQY